MMNDKNKFAVIDTETTWGDEVMSIGIVIADSRSFAPLDRRYYILTPQKNHGGMYSYALYAGGAVPDMECSRDAVIEDVKKLLTLHEVTAIFAYNANFDYGHLPELSYLEWYDIMKMAAYRQYNSKIPHTADCFKTGRLKRGYSVDSIYKMLSGKSVYRELHNALTDTLEELEIMKMLGHEIEKYEFTRIKKAVTCA